MGLAVGDSFGWSAEANRGQCVVEKTSSRAIHPVTSAFIHVSGSPGCQRDDCLPHYFAQERGCERHTWFP